MIEKLKRHLIANAMHDQWETPAETAEHMRKVFGLRISRLEIIAMIHQVGAMPVHRLSQRNRDGGGREYRIYVREAAIAEPKPIEKPFKVSARIY